ncbi:hypothetical protein [Sphingorhabdus sp. EL138]|nr:hypothetical protein [Sphingorhabdus sp. EL138]
MGGFGAGVAIGATGAGGFGAVMLLIRELTEGIGWLMTRSAPV